MSDPTDLCGYCDGPIFILEQVRTCVSCYPFDAAAEIVKLREALEEIAGYESASLSPNPLLSQVRAIAADALSDD